MTGPFRLLPDVVPLRPCEDVPGALRALADELEARQDVDLVLVVLSGPDHVLPSVRALGRPCRYAEVDGLLLQAAMLPPC